ncbi:hypothetical protein NXH64_10555 [Butyrivibrio fibrisolvens]|uniref:hypothetical protein n=1 Tax=Pseudobutyrivibrio ruminis TaxID=46206 RepID=UPI0004835406|nr:hypothetical protein [Pseudobutyrivibrio ruminis]MDC7279938.1 hypothetical protein [Butyrivibrio fibrisolvens]
MSKVIIYREYTIILMLVGCLIFITAKIIIKKRLLTNLKFTSEKAKLIINMICIPIVYAALIFCLWEYYPLMLDIPNAISKSYCVDNAIARSYDHSNPGFVERRYIDMEIDGKIEHMTLYAYGINEGEKYTVIYLPHSKIGQAVPVE